VLGLGTGKHDLDGTAPVSAWAIDVAIRQKPEQLGDDPADFL